LQGSFAGGKDCGEALLGEGSEKIALGVGTLLDQAVGTKERERGQGMTLDAIRLWCTRLQSHNARERAGAYGHLVSTPAFIAVVEQLRGHRLFLADVAKLLVDGADGATAEHVWQLLRAAIDESTAGEPASP
jgi:hypothetical protein